MIDEVSTVEYDRQRQEYGVLLIDLDVYKKRCIIN